MMTIHEHVAEFLRRFSTISTVVSDTGGEGLCEFYSCALAVWLVHRGIIAQAAWVLFDGIEYPYDVHVSGVGGSDHCVVECDGWFVDLTARQFDDAAPFPMIWEAA